MLRFQSLVSFSLYSCLWIICGAQSTINSTTTKHPIDFETLTKSPSLFVDKSMLLATIFDNLPDLDRDRSIISITTPPGFGRTTNLDMIRRFACIETDSKGARVDKFNTSSYHIFKANAQPTLAISQHDLLIQDHFATYPVVYLDLSNVTAPSLRQTMKNLHERVKESFQQYEWLEDEKLRMTRTNREILEHTKHRKEWRFINKILRKQVNAVDIHTSISKLIQILVEQFKQKVILLIDNYDAPIMDAVYQRSNTSVDQFYEFFNVFFSTTLDDSVNDTQLVILAGTHPVSIKTRTEIEFYSFLSQHDLSQFFGFTDHDLELLLARNPASGSIQDLRNYFGGYLANGSSTPLYRPASVSNYLKSISVKNCSSVSSYHSQLSVVDSHIDKLVKTFMPNVTWEQDKGIEGYWGGRSFEISPYFEIDQLERIANVVSGNESVTSCEMDTYFSILFANGYFTHPNDSAPDVIAFPNLQMMTTFQRYLK